MTRIITVFIAFLMISLYPNLKDLNGQDDISEQIKGKKSAIILEMKRDPFEEEGEKKKGGKAREEKIKEKIETRMGKEMKNIKILGKIEWEQVEENNKSKRKDKIVIVEIDNKPYILREGDKIEEIMVDKITESEVEISIEKEKIKKSF